jgi:hypothetical protein
MHRRILNTIILIATCSLSTWASSQNVYRCGNTYSQTPCPSGKALDVTDTRTADQKKQTDAASANSAKAGDAMEKSRLAQEKRDMAANKARPPAAAPVAVAKAAAEPQPRTHAKRKKKTSPYFTAQAPREKKEKKPAKAKKAASTK